MNNIQICSNKTSLKLTIGGKTIKYKFSATSALIEKLDDIRNGNTAEVSSTNTEFLTYLHSIEKEIQAFINGEPNSLVVSERLSSDSSSSSNLSSRSSSPDSPTPFGRILLNATKKDLNPMGAHK
jgi:hypothetical protein